MGLVDASSVVYDEVKPKKNAGKIQFDMDPNAPHAALLAHINGYVGQKAPEKVTGLRAPRIVDASTVKYDEPPQPDPDKIERSLGSKLWGRVGKAAGGLVYPFAHPVQFLEHPQRGALRMGGAAAGAAGDIIGAVSEPIIKPIVRAVANYSDPLIPRNVPGRPPAKPYTPPLQPLIQKGQQIWAGYAKKHPEEAQDVRDALNIGMWLFPGSKGGSLVKEGLAKAGAGKLAKKMAGGLEKHIAPKPRGFGELPSDLAFRRSPELQRNYENLYNEIFGEKPEPGQSSGNAFEKGSLGIRRYRDGDVVGRISDATAEEINALGFSTKASDVTISQKTIDHIDERRGEKLTTDDVVYLKKTIEDPTEILPNIGKDQTEHRAKSILMVRRNGKNYVSIVEVTPGEEENVLWNFWKGSIKDADRYLKKFREEKARLLESGGRHLPHFPPGSMEAGGKPESLSGSQTQETGKEMLIENEGKVKPKYFPTVKKKKPRNAFEPEEE